MDPAKQRQSKSARARHAAQEAGRSRSREAKSVVEFTTRVSKATPFERVELERKGVPGVLIKDLSRRMDISSTRIYQILGVPKATVEKKAASGRLISGSGGHAVIGMARLIALATEIAENSKAPEARDFDAARWLGQWIERPQPSLGGRKPADLLDTPTGVEIVARVLGAAESGAYQ
jgi:putative toxin-antitoxin system antitoxin component (TIGR02293 family)